MTAVRAHSRWSRALRISGLAGAAIILLLGAMIVGMASARLNTPPYTWARAVAGAVKPGLAASLGGPSSGPLPTIGEDIIRTKSPADVGRIRGDLATVLWGAPDLPSRMPDRLARGIEDEAFADIPALERIDRLTVEMEFGLVSRWYHLVPRRPNGQLVLFHKGHEDGGEFTRDADIIARLLERGYHVAAFAMPLLGPNPAVTIEDERLGTYAVRTHDQMQNLRPAAGHAVKFFIEPVIVALNYLEQRHDFSEVAMMGLSGGGWATTLTAALDPRIDSSFPVAGSLPIALRSDLRPGDFEQRAPPVYWAASYPELYVLASAGGRRQLQILNERDPCCFQAAGARAYREAVRKVAGRVGGCFEVLADGTHDEHAISPWAMERILETMRAGPQRVERC